MSELEKQSSSSDQVVTLEEEIDKLSDRVGTLQRDNQYKDEVPNTSVETLMKTYPCNILRFFSAVKIKSFIGKNLDPYR